MHANMQLSTRTLVRDVGVAPKNVCLQPQTRQLKQLFHQTQRPLKPNLKPREICRPVASAPASPAAAIQAEIPTPVKGEKVHMVILTLGSKSCCYKTL